MEAIYETNDYLMAREIPGQVTFTKLVSAEVLVDVTAATPSSVRLSFVVKNEELPLNPHNHCREIFDLLRLTIAQNYEWEAIDQIRPISAPVRIGENIASTTATSAPESETTIEPNPIPPIARFTTSLN